MVACVDLMLFLFKIHFNTACIVLILVSGDATLQVDHFMFSPSIADNMRTASLVISHAGIIVFPYGEKCKDNGIFFMACYIFLGLSLKLPA